jgi:hypothetical protein
MTTIPDKQNSETSP